VKFDDDLWLFIACRVDNTLRVQLTDNSLSRDIFPHDYCCLGDNENRPVKWLSLEALGDHQFSCASDTVRGYFITYTFVHNNLVRVYAKIFILRFTKKSV